MTAFSSMPGSTVLSHIRDVLIDVSVKKRLLSEQSSAIGGVPAPKAELAEIAALDAAADVIQFAVSAGQEAKAKGKAPPEWVMKMAAQARVALSAPTDDEDAQG